MVVIAQGELWWAESEHEKGRPYLVLTRDRALPVLNAVLVAPVTRRIRQIPTEVALGETEGLQTDCVAALDNITTVPKARLTRRLGALSGERWHEVCTSMRAAINC